MDILTPAAQSYMTTFSGFIGQFIEWGKGLFGCLLVINLLWLFLWYAVDKESLNQGLSDFCKRFFTMLVFFTLMINPSWMLSILKTVQVMGSTLTNLPLDPSSLISEGIGIANQIIEPAQKASILSMGLGLFVILIAYISVIYTFIRIALELALTLILSTALIAVSCFFLGFASLGATSVIARQTLDVFLANCVKLLGIYIVVAAGAKNIAAMSAAIPPQISSFDIYGWIIADAWLFYLIAMHLPNQLSKIISGALQETHHSTDAAALALTAVRYAQAVQPAARVATGAVGGMAKIAGSTFYNAGAHFNKPSGLNLATNTLQAAGSAAFDFAKAGVGTLTDHFKHLGNKISGGPGTGKVSGVAERMYSSAQDIKSKMSVEKSENVSNSGIGSPSSAGRKAASPSSTRSELPTSKPKSEK